jgi:hypothetical protein
LFGTETSRQTPDWKFPLDGPVVRPASNQMLLERREERQWAAHARQRLEWARKLSLDPDFSIILLGSGSICRLRLLHYGQIPECLQLFISSKSFTTLFCMPGLFPELDDTSDSAWQETVTRLARLPRREWMERICLPPTHQAVRLFSRITPHVIGPHLPLIRQAFANPLALKRLSDTTCAIDEMMLRLCQYEEFPLRWPLFRQLCRIGKTADHALGNTSIIQGQHTLYQVRHQGEFAVAGVRRSEMGAWEIDQIEGSKNAEPSQQIRGHFLQWLAVAAVANHALGA